MQRDVFRFEQCQGAGGEPPAPDFHVGMVFAHTHTHTHITPFAAFCGPAEPEPTRLTA